MKYRQGENRHRESVARVQQALKSLMQLHNDPTHILAAGELFLLYQRLLEEQEYLEIKPESAGPGERRLSGTHPEKSDSVMPICYVPWSTRWKLMLRKGPMRRANYAAASIMIAQQLCGINLLAFVADTFFRNSFFKDANHPSANQNTELLAFSLGFGTSSARYRRCSSLTTPEGLGGAGFSTGRFHACAYLS
jgi:hypothetical protein